MKLTFFSAKYAVTAVVFLTLALVVFSSCNNVKKPSESSKPHTSELTVPISESNSNTSSEVVSQADSIPEYIDTLFSADTYIKYCNASEEPNYESVYKFEKDGTMKYSYNMWEGFSQSEERYFIRKYRNGTYQILTYSDSKDTAKILFTVYNNIDISADARASFISEKEFNTIYAFHLEWNKQAAERKEE